MAVLEIATFWDGELLFLDYVRHADSQLGWTHDGNVSVHAQWVPDAERLQRKSAPWGEMASALVVAIVLHVGLLGLGLWIHDAEDPFDAPPNVFTLGTLAGPIELAASGGGNDEPTVGRTQETSTMSTPTAGAAAGADDGFVGPEEHNDESEEAARFGMVGLLAGIGGGGDGKENGWLRGGTGDLFTRDVPSLGPDLSGVGQGGGGRGAGINLEGGGAQWGALCDDTCVGGLNGHGYGTGHGRLTGRHPSVVCTLPVLSATASTHLPSEVIQRIVRQNMGRFRGCYEDGLFRNPSLSGRVVTKFMIDRAGSVVTARDGGSSLPDSSVNACIARAFETIGFPSSETATFVTYPLDLTPN